MAALPRTSSVLVVVERTADGFSAHPPDLPDCVASAASRDAVEHQVRAAIAAHLEQLRLAGAPPPASRSYATVIEASVLVPTPIACVALAAPARRWAASSARSDADAGFSQERFSALVKLHRTFMGSLERGRVNPSLATLERLAHGLRMSAWELLKMAETSSPPLQSVTARACVR